MIEFAIIGPTASGKSSLAINLALKIDAYILSLDSLSIYKEIDIVSAKPSKEELKRVKHFGIDEIYPDKHFSVDIFIDIYKKSKKLAKESNKNLIIVGGTSFYLKTLIEGISPLPKIDKSVEEKTKNMLLNINKAYKFLEKIDPIYAKKITKRDRYRIKKALNIFFSTSLIPSKYFETYPKTAVIKNLKIFEIDIDRDNLRDKIKKRTDKMLNSGLIDEIVYLEKRYTREPNAMKAIGIKETLEYLDGKIDKKELIEKISVNTARLAKRQQIFNKTQFKDKIKAPIKELEKKILEYVR